MSRQFGSEMKRVENFWKCAHLSSSVILALVSLIIRVFRSSHQEIPSVFYLILPITDLHKSGVLQCSGLLTRVHTFMVCLMAFTEITGYYFTLAPDICQVCLQPGSRVEFVVDLHKRLQTIRLRTNHTMLRQLLCVHVIISLYPSLNVN